MSRLPPAMNNGTGRNIVHGRCPRLPVPETLSQQSSYLSGMYQATSKSATSDLTVLQTALSQLLD
jgi:hypothetical protein